MHMLALVLIPPEGDASDLVEAALAPHQEQYDEATDTLDGWWDWWQIGGRFADAFGVYDSNQMTTEYAAALGDELSCYTFVTPDSVEHVPNYGDGPEADEWRQKVRDQIARLPGGRVVVVDYHR